MYAILRHIPSGDEYAVEYDQSDTIVGATNIRHLDLFDNSNSPLTDWVEIAAAYVLNDDDAASTALWLLDQNVTNILDEEDAKEN